MISVFVLFWTTFLAIIFVTLGFFLKLFRSVISGLFDTIRNTGVAIIAVFISAGVIEVVGYIVGGISKANGAEDIAMAVVELVVLVIVLGILIVVAVAAGGWVFTILYYVGAILLGLLIVVGEFLINSLDKIIVGCDKCFLFFVGKAKLRIEKM